MFLCTYGVYGVMYRSVLLCMCCACSTGMVCNLTVVYVCILCLMAKGKECSFFPVTLFQTQYLQKRLLTHCLRVWLVGELIPYTCKTCFHVWNVSLCRSPTPSSALQKAFQQKSCRQGEGSPWRSGARCIHNKSMLQMHSQGCRRSSAGRAAKLVWWQRFPAFHIGSTDWGNVVCKFCPAGHWRSQGGTCCGAQNLPHYIGLLLILSLEIWNISPFVCSIEKRLEKHKFDVLPMYQQPFCFMT